MGKHFLPTLHSAKLNELTESEVSELTSTTVYGTALAMLKRLGSHIITIGRLQKKFIRFLVLVQADWWAVFHSLTNKMHDMNHITGT
jgi:hypothetical protein